MRHAWLGAEFGHYHHFDIVPGASTIQTNIE